MRRSLTSRTIIPRRGLVTVRRVHTDAHGGVPDSSFLSELHLQLQISINILFMLGSMANDSEIYFDDSVLCFMSLLLLDGRDYPCCLHAPYLHIIFLLGSSADILGHVFPRSSEPMVVKKIA